MKIKIFLILLLSLFINLAYSNNIFSLGVGYAHSSTYQKNVENSTIKVPPIMLVYENYPLPFLGLGGDFSIAKYGEHMYYTVRARLVLNFSIPATAFAIYGGGNTGMFITSRYKQPDKYGITYSGFLGTRVYIVPKLFFVYLEGSYPYPNIMGGIGFDI